VTAQSIGGRYLVARALGTGGMARVFLCWDQRLEVWCAVKVMAEWLGAEPQARRQFAAEARTMAKLAHPNVIRIYDVVDDVASPYLVTEYVDGGSLEDLGRVHPVHAARVCAQVARALQAAHDARVIHRDVKPGNILLDRTGGARLGDFGIAVLGTRPGAAPAGTIEYMPPEQRAGQATTRSDLYALGAVLFHLVTGEPPDQLRKPARDQVLEHVPDALRPIVRRATQREPGDRFASAAELADQLESVAKRLTSRDLGELRPTARPPPRARPTGRSTSGWRTCSPGRSATARPTRSRRPGARRRGGRRPCGRVGSTSWSSIAPSTGSRSRRG
jgi:serine/threonine-protein kinase